MYVVFAVLIFGILIAIHEAGHFAAAKLSGVKVNEFSIGMGPAIVSRDGKDGTKYSLRCLPIGGYCAMEGEEQNSDDPRAYMNQSIWKKLVILVAGSGMNFLLGLLLIILVFAGAESFTTPTVTGFMDGCPYEGEAGLLEGDTFWSIDGERVFFSSDVSQLMARADDEYVDIVLLRDGEKVRLDDYHMTLREYVQDGESVQRYGIYFGVKESGFFALLKYSWYEARSFVRMVIWGLSDLITGAVGIKQMSGVVGIVDTINEVGTTSATFMDALLNIAYLTAFIAINLAVMNMLPIPALDGGRIFFLLITTLIEAVTKKRLDPKYEGYINAASFVLLMGLMVLVMYNDIVRIVTR